jgi:hypothetical protein
MRGRGSRLSIADTPIDFLFGAVAFACLSFILTAYDQNGKAAC